MQELNTEAPTLKTQQSPWKTLSETDRYYAYLRSNETAPEPLIKKPRPWTQYVRSKPVEIPLEAKEKLPDPRLEPKFKFLTLPGVTINDDILDTSDTIETLSHKETEIQQQLDDIADKLLEAIENPTPTDSQQEDALQLEIEDWLTIDSTGFTADPDLLIPPTEFIEENYLDI